MKRFSCVALGSVLVVTAACSSSQATQVANLTPGSDGSFPLQPQASSGQVSIPWSLDRIDTTGNRIYLTASKVNCSYPESIVMNETSTTIDIKVYGNLDPGNSCSADGYVTSGFVAPKTPIRARTVQQ